MNKTAFKNEVKNLLKPNDLVDIVFFYDGAYHIISDCQIVEIPQPKAFELLSRGADLHNINVSTSPAGISKNAKLYNITCVDPVTDYVKIFLHLTEAIEHFRNGRPMPITGIKFVRAE